MWDVLRNRTYRHLLMAQVIALVGTGLATVALGLLAFDLAGARAGEVLGTALAIKMIAYVGIAPVAGALAERLPRRAMLVTLDLVRAAVACLLPFVTEIWQIYVLIFVLQAASAGFTPTFQATIPDVLPDDAQYTRALSLSRVAYDLESLVSPLLAAVLLSVVSFHTLFFGTLAGFLVSACLVASVRLPTPTAATPRPFYERTTRGIRNYLATPRLRGLLALTLAVAAASAMVIVNTVVLVQGQLGLSQRFTAVALAAFGCGSMTMAFALPRVLERLDARRTMLAGGAVLVVGLFAGSQVVGYSNLLALWFVLGLAYSATQAPTGLLLKRSSKASDRPGLFAAQFALSHGCWLIAYPLAGWSVSRAGGSAGFLVLSGLALIAWVMSVCAWPSKDPLEIEHEHFGVDTSDPHVAGAEQVGGGKWRHRHAFVIDREHPEWPRTP
ncbi:MAG: MFS transporter [Pseudomonadota bacterium]